MEISVLCSWKNVILHAQIPFWRKEKMGYRTLQIPKNDVWKNVSGWQSLYVCVRLTNRLEYEKFNRSQRNRIYKCRPKQQTYLIKEKHYNIILSSTQQSNQQNSSDLILVFVSQTSWTIFWSLKRAFAQSRSLVYKATEPLKKGTQKEQLTDNTV